MSKHVLQLTISGIILLAFGSSNAVAQPGSSNRIDVPAVPQNLEVPAGHSVFLKGHAAGTQNYICLPTSEGSKWTFLAPQATLFQMLGAKYQQITTHFLAVNPSQNGGLFPSWLDSRDSSQVWARRLEGSEDPSFVEAGAIPWLLLRVNGADVGPAGGSLLTNTTFIQRLNTSGGAAPTAECSIGDLQLVPYAADYFFYRASRKR